MILYLIGSNTVIATMECSKGHSLCLGDAHRFLLLKDNKREIHCPERDSFKCPESISVEKLKKNIEGMLKRGETMREIDKQDQLTIGEELL